jgi:putative NIF3 family GTP cyclohydrolase 1 type 2
MDAPTLFDRLEADFDLAHCRDDWSSHMQLTDHYTDNFRRRSMGLMLDNTSEVHQVFTAVFPSPRILDHLLQTNTRDCLLVLHHAMHWDIRHKPVFIAIDESHLAALQDHRISLYVMHTPLDRSGPYSTTNTLAAALDIDKTADFFEYFGWPCGAIGTTTCRTTGELARTAAATVGHRARIYPYGDDLIDDGRVALIAGGGNDPAVHEQLAALDIHTFVTGITARNEHSQAAHDLARRHGINLIGLTHYSTERFACVALCEYFARLGQPCSFLPDEPVLEDMG